ncbi:hypothetical protein IID22_02690 [Patescibacteria group bacterium]|nr:hypothetical protein [Patescibacteria group bacterium]
MLNKLPKSSSTTHYPLPTQGFSIIELVVVIGTMALLFSLGYANYRDFQRRQQLDSVINEFKTDLRLAQQLALTGNKPTGCTTLEGYRIRRDGDKSYKILAYCGSPVTCSVDPDYCVKDVNLPSNISIGTFAPSPGNRFMFQVLARGVDRDGETTITFTQDVTGDTRSVIVTPSGEIK